MTSVWASWITLLSPLAAALVITLAGTSISRRVAGVVATAGTGVAFVAAVVAFVDLLGEDAERRSHLDTAWTWLGAGDFRVGLEILVDPLSIFMMLVVTGVGSLIVAYSIGYMDGDDEERRFFAYMALFVFSMLLLVQGGNLLLLLAGWGLVGLSSYLLIGFHHERPSAIAAAKKAFIMNAFGDATFALALFLIVKETGSLDFVSAFELEGQASGTVVNLVALGLLGGAVAKSAQIPLHTWLPDAMEGPTPVSALIHAATMVTAGVYLIVRLHPIFESAWAIHNLAAILGAVTLVVAGLIALVQTDIKRVIAYSTMSQIGYMFLGAGLGAYANGMFHLLTHAFFKALLFLAAGVVIHALAGEQDMRKMGGLKRLMPFTYWCFLIGALSLVGMPPFAGFFSKDSILAAALDRGAIGAILFSVGIVGTFLTGLYTFRMLYLVFHGPRSAYAREHHLHRGREGPLTMLAPVAVLAVLSVIGGWLQFAGVWTPVTDFLAPVAEPHGEANAWKEILASLLAVGVGLGGMLVAWAIYGARHWTVPRWTFVRRALEEKLGWDWLYDRIFYVPVSWLASATLRWFERPVISGSALGIGVGARETGELASEVQTGYLRAYALALATGLAVLVLVFISVK